MGCISLQFAGLQVSQHYYYGYGNRLLAKWRKIRNRISQHWHFPILFVLSLCPHVASFICLGFKEKLLETMVPSPNILGFPSIHPSIQAPAAGRGLWRRQRGPLRLPDLPDPHGVGQALQEHSIHWEVAKLPRVPGPRRIGLWNGATFAWHSSFAL